MLAIAGSSPANASNLIKFMCQIGLISPECEKYRFGSRYEKNNYAKTYRYYYDNIDLQNTAITTIPQHVFFNCNIKRLILPKRLTSIMPITFGTWMIRPWDAVEIPFYPSPIVIPDGVTSLADNSFNINFSQNSVDIYIPKSVTSIQPNALRVYHSNYPLTIHCERGSEALRYAREYGLGAVEWERSGENIPYPHEIPTINEVRKEILQMQKRTKDMQYQEAMRYQHDLSYGDETDYL